MPTNTGVPRAAQLSAVSTISWASGTPFNGAVWVGLNLPTGYSQPSLANSYIPQQLPKYIRVPIVNGVIDSTTGVPWNSDIDPPGTSYVVYYIDNNNAVIAPASGTASTFSIGSATQVLTVPTLAQPTISGSSVFPQTSTAP